MRGRMVLLVGAIALCLGLVGTPASWANSLTFQNVTFDLSLNGGNLDLHVTNALNANGDWAGIDTLNAFQINNYGTASGLAVSGWTTVPGGLSAGAYCCDGSGAGTCFSNAGFALSNDFTLEVTKTSGAFNLNLLDSDTGLFGPHLKVFFGGADVPNGHGNLLSQTVTGAVPVPGTLLMFGLGFVLLIAGYQWYKRPTGLAGASA